MTFDEMAPVVDFLNSFLHCLTPVPWDRDIDSLVRRAHTVIKKSFKSMKQEEKPVPPAGINATNACSLMDKWKLHQESEEARWQRFHSRYSVHDANPKDGKHNPNPFERYKEWQDLYQSHPGRNVRQLLRARKTLDEKLLKCIVG
jgi:hypothetical protein